MSGFLTTYQPALEWIGGTILVVACLKALWLIGLALWKQLKKGTYDL